ncbi:MAG TPA: GvpL/GvpF family gas vesicle protein [Candidatus Angelobacter sp.]|nr:GvpL/GvpF family gas vesicle protein [Candidatus Angelobacter sp.]
MSRILVYCGFRQAPGIALPTVGVNAAPVQVASFDDLSLLWSEVEWPFDPQRMQKSAVEFHEVVYQVFKQSAVIPFRLLSVFDDQQAFSAFAAENRQRFLEDLIRLKDVVQMECVIYPKPSETPVDRTSGKAYLEQKAIALRSSEASVQATQEALAHLSREVRVREGKNGKRIFVLVDRSRENDFRQAVAAVPIPMHLSRRMSGPWPAAEFLSEQVKMPQTDGVAGAK